MDTALVDVTLPSPDMGTPTKMPPASTRATPSKEYLKEFTPTIELNTFS